MRFGIYIEKDPKTGKRTYFAQNDGMPVPEVILVLDAVLDRSKQSFKDSVEGDVAF